MNNQRSGSTALVLTTINSPNDALNLLADGCRDHGYHFVIAGDTKSPDDFRLEGANFLNIDAQNSSGFHLAKLCPTQHYARKNIAYLVAIRDGAKLIIETDDDNLPYSTFWESRSMIKTVPICEGLGWLNVYSYFTKTNVWPRGYPLDELQNEIQPIGMYPIQSVHCPVQQGLANINPDVDAIYRLIYNKPVEMIRDGNLALGNGTWSPFNSQNTSWWEIAFPLLYLPAYCSFRMTDIWRSFIAQRIMWANGWYLLFHGATVWQNRNEHILMDDFENEIPGYRGNKKFTKILLKLNLEPGIDNIYDNLLECYKALVTHGFFPRKELKLVRAWISDLKNLPTKFQSHQSKRLGL